MDLLTSAVGDRVFDIAGVTGFCIYVASYSLLTCQVLTSRCITYFVLNLCASCLVLLSLVGAFNLATALIQSFWIIVSLIAIRMRLRDRRDTRAEAEVSFSRLRAATMS